MKIGNLTFVHCLQVKCGRIFVFGNILEFVKFQTVIFFLIEYWYAVNRVRLFISTPNRVIMPSKQAQKISSGKSQTQLLENLHKIAKEILKTREKEELLTRIASSTKEYLNAESVILYVYLEDSKEFELPPIVFGNVSQRNILATKGQFHNASLIFPLIKTSKPYYATSANQDWQKFLELHGITRSDSIGFIKREGIKSSVGIPLVSKRGKYGVIFVNYTSIQNFSKAYKTAVELLAYYALIAMENSSFIEKAEASRRENDALNQIISSITQSPSMSEEKLLENIYRETRKVLNVNNFYVALCSEGETNKTINFPIAYEGNTNKKGTAEYRTRDWGNGLTEHVISSGKSRLIKESMSEWLSQNECDEIGRFAKSWLGVPMKIGSNILGVIALQDFSHEGVFDENHELILSTIAKQATIAIDNLRNYKELADKSKQLETVNELAVEMGQTEVENRYSAIVEAATKIFNVQGGKLYLLNSERNEVVLKASKGVDNSLHPIGSRLLIGEGVAGDVIQNNRPLIVDNYFEYPNRIEKLRNMFGSIFGVPLSIRGRAIGVLVVFDKSKKKKWKWSDVPALERFAPFASIAARDIQLIEEIEKRANTLSALNEANKSIQSKITNIDNTLDEIAKVSLKLVSEDVRDKTRCVIYLQNSERLLEVRSIFPREHFINIRKGDEVLESDEEYLINPNEVLISGKPKVKYAIKDPKEKEPYYPSSGVSVPIRYGNLILGVLSLENMGELEFSEDDINALVMISSDAGSAINQAGDIRELESITSELGAAGGLFAEHFYYEEIVHDLLSVIGQTNLTLRRLQKDSGMKKISKSSKIKLDALISRVAGTADTMNEFLDEVGKYDKTKSKHQINPIIQQVLRLLDSGISKHNIKLDISNLERNLPWVYINRIEIFMVLFNLISNAIDALSQGSKNRRLNIATHLKKKDDRFVEISIEDTGIGITKSAQMRIFEERFSTKKDKGRGLGLYGSKRILQEHRGEISFQSTHGKGTTFRISLPKS